LLSHPRLMQRFWRFVAIGWCAWVREPNVQAAGIALQRLHNVQPHGTSMKSPLFAAGGLAAAMLLSACASNTAAPTAKVAAANTMYCHQDRLYTAGNEYVCNWTPSLTEACRDTAPASRLATSAVTGAPTQATRCASGVWLVQATRRNAG
jgi:hypothetical protein